MLEREVGAGEVGNDHAHVEEFLQPLGAPRDHHPHDRRRLTDVVNAGVHGVAVTDRRADRTRGACAASADATSAASSAPTGLQDATAGRDAAERHVTCRAVHEREMDLELVHVLVLGGGRVDAQVLQPLRIGDGSRRDLRLPHRPLLEGDRKVSDAVGERRGSGRGQVAVVPRVHGVLSVDEVGDVCFARVIRRRRVADAVGVEDENIGPLYESRATRDRDVQTRSDGYRLHDDRHGVGLRARARVNRQRRGLGSGRRVGVVGNRGARGAAVAEGPAVAGDTDERAGRGAVEVHRLVHDRGLVVTGLCDQRFAESDRHRARADVGVHAVAHREPDRIVARLRVGVRQRTVGQRPR